MIRMAALISGADFSNRRGLMNVALKRIELLSRCQDYQVDLYGVTIRYRKLTCSRFLKGEFSKEVITLGGHKITLLVKTEFYSDSRLFRKPLKLFHKYTRFRNSDWEWHKHFARVLKDYDAITAHFNDAAIIAESVHSKYGVPYFVTWHGSDIHTIPHNDSAAKVKTIKAIENAAGNFFVSYALLNSSESLTVRGKKYVLYNGVDDNFKRFSDEERNNLRARYSLSDEKVVTFAGNLRPVKNANLLPQIFAKIEAGYYGRLSFWIVGDGELKSAIERGMEERNVKCRFFGSLPYTEMPDIFNCTDVLVLPSKDEGMGLVILEAMSCGANVVASDVGGIKELLSMESRVAFSDHFISDFASLVVNKLNTPTSIVIEDCFNWERTSMIEDQIYRETLG